MTTYTVSVKFDGSAAGLARASKEAQAHIKAMGGNSAKEFNKMAKARELLGVRPEREIQREIMRTEAAYNRLARSGTMSFHEQRRAAKATREEVTKLTNEMGRLTGRQKAMRGLKIAGGLAAGAGIATALIAPTVRKTMAYDLRLAHLANTAFNNRDKAGRVAGRRELDADINDAVRYGGGTRDSAMNTAESLYGSGIFKPAEVKKILREAVMAATANDADPLAFAEMASKANRSMGIKPEQMGRMFGMGTFAGQSGGFEIKDMAKWLPQQMAAAKVVGLYGEAGFAKLAALNQGAVVTAGTKDEAGNNVVNLLAKMGSKDTAKDFKNMGIDLPKQFAEGRMKGLDALDVVGNLLQAQLAKDKNYQNVQQQLKAAKNDDERLNALNAVGNIAQGTVIGKVFQDRQALMALYGFVNDRDRVNAIASGAMSNTDAAQKNMDVIGDTAGFKAEQAANARDIAMQQSMDKMMPAIGGMADGLTNLMTKYPGYTTVILGATAAITGLAGAAGMAALALGKGGIPGLPGGSGTPGAGGGARTAGKGGVLKGVGKIAGAAGAIYAGYLALDWAETQLWEAMSPDGQDPRKSGGGRSAGGSGVRGRGFNDPRIIGGGTATAAALEQSLKATEVKGEIFVRVSAAPGIIAETTMTSGNARIPMKAALGPTNLRAGM